MSKLSILELVKLRDYCKEKLERIHSKYHEQGTIDDVKTTTNIEWKNEANIYLQGVTKELLADKESVKMQNQSIRLNFL